MNCSKKVTNKEASKFFKYYYSFFIFNSVSILVIILCFVIILYYKVGPYHKLYAYQINKLNKNQSNIDTIFIGDSSLGQAINADLFNTISGLKSINLALTGLYGLAGSYNMIKKATKLNQVKNVILMQTLDLISRPVAYDGYLYSMENFDDFVELTFNEKILLIKTSINILFSFTNLKRIIHFFPVQERLKYTIENDYMKQVTIKDRKKKYKNIRIHINKDKIIFLHKIVSYCNQHRINLIYIHGPHLNNINNQSRQDIQDVNAIIKSTGVNFINKSYFFSPQQMGDSLDHIYPDFKDQITEEYFNYIKNDLVY